MIEGHREEPRRDRRGAALAGVRRGCSASRRAWSPGSTGGSAPTRSRTRSPRASATSARSAGGSASRLAASAGSRANAAISSASRSRLVLGHERPASPRSAPGARSGSRARAARRTRSGRSPSPAPRRSAPACRTRRTCAPPPACARGRGALQQLARVAPHAAVAAAGSHPAVGDLGRDAALRQPAEGDRRVAQRPDPHAAARAPHTNARDARARTASLKSSAGTSSYASQFVSTSRPIALGVRVTTIWHSAPPVSLPTSVTLSRSSAAMKSAISLATRGRGEVGVGRHRRLCEPSGRSGAMQRKSFASRARPSPQVAVHERAVHEDDRLAGAALAVADRALGELTSLLLAKLLSKSTSLHPPICTVSAYIQLVSNIHTV